MSERNCGGGAHGGVVHYKGANMSGTYPMLIQKGLKLSWVLSERRMATEVVST